MSAKLKNIYICSNCGYESPKWYGKCPDCGEWNSFVEEVKQVTPSNSKGVFVPTSSVNAQKISEIDTDDEIRYKTGLNELDRVLGGGIVKGSLVLIGGDPGIGKSTLLLQICEFLGRNLKIMYISGEESAKQVKMRANRLNVRTDNLYLASNTDVASIIDSIYSNKPDIVMIDSIQTMTVAGVSSSAGSVTQVRESTNAFLKCAKENDIPIFIVGHVNKDGAIAGPKVLEHIVDAVLYFEGERNLSYRILRAVKNRYGSTNEIGVFEMSTDGLQEVENPSMMLLSGRPTNVSGTAVVCVMEGSRPVLAEVQALVTKTGFGNPRRTATGFDYNRMAMILAVLEKRVGLMFSSSDAFINIIGGLKLDEPAADLAVALALVSSFRDIIIDDKTIMMGEIGLAGEIRNISFASQRIAEAARLGFNRFIIPHNAVLSLDKSISSLDVRIIGVKSIGEAIAALARSE